MQNSRIVTKVIALLLGTLAFLLSATSAHASHSWGGYHWARTQNPFTLKVGDNLSSSWDSYLLTAKNNWSLSPTLDLRIVAGKTSARACRPTLGRVEVCNYKYGANGWLGIAQIWVSGEHITQGVTKLNDTYFNTPTYNKAAWKNLVMCQEAGHTLGLAHQDEDFYSTPLGSCMDYSADPAPNQRPNQHDYNMLTLLYGHNDSTSTVGQSTTQNQNLNAELHNRSEWGRQIKNNGKVAMFERNFGNNQKVFTFVIWVDGEQTQEEY